MKEPFSRNEAKKLIQAILKTGTITPTSHARRELANDDMSTVDAMNVLRAGRITEEAEWENESWRYRVHTERMVVVVAFVSEEELRIITAWRKK